MCGPTTRSTRRARVERAHERALSDCYDVNCNLGTSDRNGSNYDIQYRQSVIRRCGYIAEEENPTRPW